MTTSGSALAVATLAPPFTLTAAATRTWRVAVIGHTKRGDYGHELDVMWQRIPGAEIVAVADADATGLAAARKRLGDVPGFVDYRQMLADAKPDVVAVAPRHVDQHHAMCLAAIAAGTRGIYIEKPFCRSPREADEIVAACAEKNVKLAVAHRNRYHPVLPVIKRQLAAGEIGKLLEIRARGKEDTRGGAQDLWVLGSHLFNLAATLAGPPTACSAMLYQNGKPCTRDDIRDGAEGIGPIAGNAVHARFEMADGTPFFFDSIQNHGDRVAGFGLQFIGTSGAIDIRVDQEAFAHFRRGNPHIPVGATQPWLPITSAGIDRPEAIPDLAARIASHQAAGEDLIEAIEQNRAPLCDAAAGRTTIEMICAIFESHRHGGARVTMPLQTRDQPLSLM
jgi:predicted dehydrogenase